jgi:hypothetical protein
MADEKTITLPSGKIAVGRPGKGRDLRMAGRLVNPGSDPIGYTMAILAQLVTIDGKAIVLEDIEEMSMEDTAALLELLPGNSLTRGISSSSSPSPAGRPM